MAGEIWTYFDGDWHEGNLPVFNVMDHATWLGAVTFDGARAFEGVTPDLDLHCRRAVSSARYLGMAPGLDADAIQGLVHDGRKRFAADAPLYIRPMFWATDGWIEPDPETTRFALVLNVWAMPDPARGGSICVSHHHRKPTPESAPTLAKAACLYPQNGLANMEAKRRGFEGAIMLDANGNVAELSSANLFIVKDGVVATPVANGTFLAGITRARTIDLLRRDGTTVEERTVSPTEVLEADEVFSTGNFAKVVPLTRVEDRHIQPGPVAARARRLYWDYAHA